MDYMAQKTIVPKILAKLPTRDVARCGCVSRLWRHIVADLSFRALHGANASGGDMAENLLVADMVILNLSSPSSERPMCRVTDLAPFAEYSPANACNGFLLFAPHVQDDDWSLCICNPVTGEKLLLSPPPAVEHVTSCTYALGFSPSTLQYKLFCLSFSHNDCYMDVRTLGGHGEQWRRHPDRLPYRAVSTPPALVDGKLYFPCGEGSDRMLVIDVASEVHRTYRLPRCEGEKVATLAFDLRGRLCVAVHVLGRNKLHFWTMPLLQSHDKNDGTALLDWKLRYKFHMMNTDNSSDNDLPRGAWLDNSDGILSYRMGNRLYKYDTTKNNRRSQVSGLLKWDNRIQLPSPPKQQQWNVYGGYRPCLVSPHLALASLQHGHNEQQFKDSLLRALRYQRSSKKPRV